MRRAPGAWPRPVPLTAAGSGESARDDVVREQQIAETIAPRARAYLESLTHSIEEWERAERSGARGQGVRRR
jgi:hypothetical protein